MGVDFFDCTICKKSVCECGPYEYCDSCGNQFCTGCFDAPSRRDFPDTIDGENEYYEEKSRCCPVCSKVVILDSDLLELVLKKLEWSREKAEEEYRAFINKEMI